MLAFLHASTVTFYSLNGLTVKKRRLRLFGANTSIPISPNPPEHPRHCPIPWLRLVCDISVRAGSKNMLSDWRKQAIAQVCAVYSPQPRVCLTRTSRCVRPSLGYHSKRICQLQKAEDKLKAKTPRERCALTLTGLQAGVPDIERALWQYLAGVCAGFRSLSCRPALRRRWSGGKTTHAACPGR